MVAFPEHTSAHARVNANATARGEEFIAIWFPSWPARSSFALLFYGCFASGHPTRASHKHRIILERGGRVPQGRPLRHRWNGWKSIQRSVIQLPPSIHVYSNFPFCNFFHATWKNVQDHRFPIFLALSPPFQEKKHTHTHTHTLIPILEINNVIYSFPNFLGHSSHFFKQSFDGAPLRWSILYYILKSRDRFLKLLY